MKRIVLTICSLMVTLVFLFPNNISASAAMDIENELNTYDFGELEGYIGGESDYYTNSQGFLETVKDFATGKQVLSVSEIAKSVLSAFLNEARGSVVLLLSVIAISLLFSFLNNMNGDFASTNVSETAFFVCYLILATLLLKAFSQASALVVSSVKSASSFINAASPVLMSMLVFGGSVGSASVINPVILFATQIVSVVSEKFLVPLLYSSAALYIVSEINETIKVSKFADFLKKTVKWCMCLMLTIFSGVLGIQSFCAATIDGAAAKTARYLVGTAVPVVGGILSDTIETLVGCSNIIKNATGAAGMIAVLVIATVPVIKILAVSVTFYLGAAVLEPMADRRISSVISSLASITSLMAAIIVTAAVMFIICIGMVMCLGNTS